MKITKSGKVHFLEPAIFAIQGISSQGFTTRHEGISRPPYNSLNLGANTFDSPHNVQGNRSLLARAAGSRVEKLVTVSQLHGTDLLVIDSPNPDYSHFHGLECDGIITNQKEIIIGICVADCVPLLLLDPVKRVAATLHAGWKGTAGGIAGKGVEAMVALFGSKPGDILAAIGPGIGSCCYEVDTPVMEAFRKKGQQWELFASEAGQGKWKLDLAAANHRQFLHAGLLKENIESSSHCVACEHDLFFSYRRDGGNTGRNMGFIMLR
jgi:YfiH family protein